MQLNQAKERNQVKRKSLAGTLTGSPLAHVFTLASGLPALPSLRSSPLGRAVRPLDSLAIDTTHTKRVKL